MLHPTMKELQQERRIKHKLAGNNKPCTLPDVQKIPSMEKFPLCMKNIIEKPTGGEEQTRASTGKGEKALIEKTCKNCNQTFLTENPKKETVRLNAGLPIPEGKQ